MKRTTLMLPEDLRERAARRARRMGVSLGEFIRRSMVLMLSRPESPGEPDPWLADAAVHEGPVPHDLAAHHDRYLYDRAEPEGQ